jgi:hypothetical protein
MTWQNQSFDHWNQPHVQFEGNGVVDVFNACINNFFFLTQLYPPDPNRITKKKNHHAFTN